MTTLRRAIHHCLQKIGLKHSAWSARASRATSRDLAQDLGLPVDVVSRVLDQAAADLQILSTMDAAVDARPVINKAVSELAKFGFQSPPLDAAAMDRCLQELAEPDLDILRHFKRGMKQAEIAALMGTDVETVRRSLVRTYTDLRIKMMGWQDGGGQSLLAPRTPSASARSVSSTS
jgi:DNA-binding NarL/FixJ family response regulator